MTTESLAQQATDAYDTARHSASELRARLEREGAQWSVAEFATQKTRCEQLDLRVAQARQARDSANKAFDAERDAESKREAAEKLRLAVEQKTSELNACHSTLAEIQAQVESLHHQAALEATKHSRLLRELADLKGKL